MLYGAGNMFLTVPLHSRIPIVKQVVAFLEKLPISAPDDVLFVTAQVAKEKELAVELIATQLTENKLLTRN